MTEYVQFKSRGSHLAPAVWEVIKDGARSVDLQNVESGRRLYSINRDRLVAVTPTEQEPTP